jgi:hypothetical protein
VASTAAKGARLSLLFPLSLSAGGGNAGQPALSPLRALQISRGTQLRAGLMNAAAARLVGISGASAPEVDCAEKSQVEITFRRARDGGDAGPVEKLEKIVVLARERGVPRLRPVGASLRSG